MLQQRQYRVPILKDSAEQYSDDGCLDTVVFNCHPHYNHLNFNHRHSSNHQTTTNQQSQSKSILSNSHPNVSFTPYHNRRSLNRCAIKHNYKCSALSSPLPDNNNYRYSSISKTATKSYIESILFSFHHHQSPNVLVTIANSSLMLLLFSLIFLGNSLSVLTISLQCPEIFEGRCQCGIVPYSANGRPTFVTNCTGTRFNDTKIFAHIPTETEVLMFNGNNFTELTANLINQNQRYDKLYVVDLSDNHIRTIHGKAFHNMKSVQAFHLNRNNLSVIDPTNPDDTLVDGSNGNQNHPRMFATLKNLEELYLNDAFDRRQQSTSSPDSFMRSLWQIFNQSQLSSLKVLSLEHNDLSTIGQSEQFFCTLPELQRLSLAHNRLTKYRLNATCLPLLNHVDFSDNYIETIDNRSLALIGTGPASYHLNLSENPFRCDCRMKSFFLFVRNLTSPTVGWPAPKLERAERFRCSGDSGGDGESSRLLGKYFDDLSENDFGVCSLHTSSGLAVLESESAIQSDDDPETVRHKSDALRRYRRYITLSYLVLVFLLVLLLCLIGILIYTNRDYLLSTWNFFLMELNAKRDYTALDKETVGSLGETSGSSGQGSSSGSSNISNNGKPKQQRNNRYRGFGGQKHSVRITPLETMVAEVQV